MTQDTVVTLSLAIAVVLGGWLIAARVSAQLDLLIDTLPESLAKLEKYLSDYIWGRKLLERALSASRRACKASGRFLFTVENRGLAPCG